MRISSTLFAVVALVALGACSHAAKVSTSGDSTTVTTDQGQVTVGKSIDAAKLGVPVYPGAEQNPGSVEASSSNGAGSIATFKTADSFDKVYAFNQSQLPKGADKMKTTTGTTSMAIFNLTIAGSTDEANVEITSSDSGTAIMITRATKK